MPRCRHAAARPPHLWASWPSLGIVRMVQTVQGFVLFTVEVLWGFRVEGFGRILWFRVEVLWGVFGFRLIPYQPWHALSCGT